MDRRRMPSSRLSRNRNFVRSATIIQSGPITVSMMLITLGVLLSLLYLNQISKTSTFNFEVRRLEQKKSSLNSLREKLEIDSARLQSIIYGV